MSSFPQQDIYAETLAVFERNEDPYEPLTTPEVAEALDANRRTVYKRLKKLVAHGELKTKEAGSRARVWWRRSSFTDQWDSERRSELETQRNILWQELSETYDRIDEAVYALDEEWRFTHLNEQAEQLLGQTEKELRGEVVWEQFPDTVGMNAYHNFHEAMETQESIQFEEYYVPHQRWYEIRVYPSPTGVSVHFHDVTELKNREEDLERYEAIIEAIGDPVYTLDNLGRFTYVNDALEERSGYTASELLGQDVSIGMDDENLERMVSIMADLYADNSTETATSEFEAITKGGEWIPVENHISLLTDDDGQVRGSAGVLRDITERKERERALEESERRYKTLIQNFPNGIVGLFDEDLRYLIAGGALYDLLDRSPADTVGKTLYECDSPDEVAVREPLYRAALAGESNSIVTEYKDRTVKLWTLPVRDENGDVFAGMAMSQDITEQKRHERELEKQIRQQEVITELGQQALEIRDIDALMATAAELVADTLDNEYCKVLEFNTDAEELVLRQGVGWDDGIVGSAKVSAVEADSHAAYTLASSHPIVVENLETESRFNGPELLTSHAVRSGISTIIGSSDDPWGVLGTHDTTRKEFSEHDVNFIQSVAHILATAINRHQDEQRLRRQRKELATLNDLNSIVSEITDAVIDLSTRGEIEQTVCDVLAAADVYEFAWVAEADPSTNTIEPRATAETRGYAQELTISLDPDDPSSSGPGVTAIREQQTQVITDVFSDPDFEPWRDAAAEYGFSAVASIPIVHSGTVYGVLGVYADRSNAFESAEREIISQLGKITGHAIAAVERKRALLSSEVTELEFRLRDVFEAADSSNSMKGTITLDRAVPIGAGSFLEYGTAREGAIDAVRAMVDSDSHPHWESVNVLRTDGETTHFELRMTEPPVLSTVVAHGGYVEDARIEDGDFYFRIHLAPAVNIRQVIGTIKDTYPATDVGSQRQVTRDQPSAAHLKGTLFEELTERQRAALEAGYYAGFFEWPRTSSGEDVAASLDIGSSTFHQHLRKAENTLLDLVFTES